RKYAGLAAGSRLQPVSKSHPRSTDAEEEAENAPDVLRLSTSYGCPYLFPAKKGFRVFTPERTKSSVFRVTIVSLCSIPVAASKPSLTGSGWSRANRPQRSAIAAETGKMRSA